MTATRTTSLLTRLVGRAPGRRRLMARATVAIVSTSALALAAGCGSDAGPAAGASGSSGSNGAQTTLTVYTDQHAELVEGLTKAYTAATGVRFNIQNDATVGQIQAEGSAAKADVFLSEDPGPAAQLGAAGLFAPVDPATLAQVAPGLSSGKGLWVAYAARTRVLYYNPTKIAESALPKTLADIVAPRYQGMFAWAPSTDPGNLILSSGAGVLKSSQNQPAAQKFLAWLTAKDGGQKLIADAPADVSEAQYPVAPGVASSVSGDLSEIKSPTFDMDSLADSQQAENLLKQLGLSKG